MAQFADCHFDELVLPTLRRQNKQLVKEISWNELSLSHLCPRTNQCELEVQEIIHLKSLVGQLRDAFTVPKKVTKSYIPVINALIKIDVIVGQINTTNESKACMKRGRPIGSKDKTPRKIKGAKNQDSQIDDTVTLEESVGKSPVITNISVPKETHVPEICENEEISINYDINDTKWNQNEVNVDNIFAYNIAFNVINNEDHEPKFVEECRQ